jgi:hypothetical protein
MEWSEMQQWHKGSSHETTATSWKREDNQHDLQKGHQAGYFKTSIEDLKRVSENKEIDLVERTAPSETEKESCTE